jgi:hypothetical protein
MVMGRLKEAWHDAFDQEDLLAKAYDWEDQQKFENRVRLHDQIKLCGELGDTLLLQSSIERLPVRMSSLIDRLQRELYTLGALSDDAF